jgi:3-oxoacyl-[acyl-carrier protein] reductase
MWDQTIDINLKGTFLCSREAAPLMLKQNKGRIINISSNSAMYHPSAMKFPDYVASKAGINGLTKALALRLGPAITVNAICPGAIVTEMTSFRNSAANDALINETPLKRLGDPIDVADAAVFLASDMASFITGELMLVTGGRGMHQ